MARNDQFLSCGPKCRIPISDISWKFGPAGGPGGQHANRVNSRVDASLDLANAHGIEEDVRKVLLNKLGSVVKVSVDRHRSQFRNRELALKRLESNLKDALVELAPRRKTRPTRNSVEKRLKNKREQSERKASRRRLWDD